MTFHSRSDYEVALLRLLASTTGHQGRAGDICSRFEQEYRDQIPAEHYELLDSGEQRWHKNLHWARYQLVQLRLLDSPRRGTWKITQAGLDWIEQNPTAMQSKERPASKKTVKSDVRAHAILDKQLAQIQVFLQGRTSHPSGEMLCDWVQICYTFEQFDEGYELFKLIEPGAVNEWFYARTKRLAQVCRIRAKHKG